MDFELSAGILAAGPVQRVYCLDPEHADRDGGVECLRGTQPVATRAAPPAPACTWRCNAARVVPSS
jgi:hypothetical protein